jgi:hypothetical protein
MNRRRITDIFQIDSSVSLWSEVTEILRLYSPSFQTDFIRPVFNSVNDLYHGDFPGYRACNTGYHDFSHATATFLAMTRLIHGAALDNCVFSASNVVAGLAAAILHDVGYIQESDDREGTGAKHKALHEQRSMDFLSRHGKAFGLSADEICAGRSIISCTDMQEDIASISFASRQIKFLGKLLASTDLLAQLSDQIYLEKLLFLFHECREAEVGNYKRESDIIEKALPFYSIFENRLKLLKLKTDRYMTSHFNSRSNIDENLYRVAIKRHKKYLDRILSDKDADPRNHLRRGGIVATVCRQYGSQDCSN